VHAIALCAAPFLSSDPLMYAAVGRALSGGASAATGVEDALGAAHAFLTPLPPAWRNGTSAYGPVWNLLASIMGGLAGDELALALRLHQLLAALALLLGAWLASRLVEPARRRAAFVLVALCPLGVIEASIGAHNDALLAPLVALALWAQLRRQTPLALAILALGLAIKASALVFLGPALAAAVLAQLPTRRARLLLLLAAAPLALLALASLSLLANGPLDALARVVGSPDVAHDHCTRSLECLPRVLFRFVLHAPYASWVTGIVFRLLGLIWLGYVALRAAEAYRDAEAPRELAVTWLVRGLFFYFLLLHGWAQSWYVLPLLPALPLLVEDTRWSPAFATYLVCAVAYYALVLPMSCLTNQVMIAVADLVEAMITVFPAAYLLLRKPTRSS